MMEAAVRPVGPDLELRRRPRPVREPELPRGPVSRGRRRRSWAASAATPGAPSGCRPVTCRRRPSRRAGGLGTRRRRSSRSSPRTAAGRRPAQRPGSGAGRSPHPRRGVVSTAPRSGTRSARGPGHRPGAVLPSRCGRSAPTRPRRAARPRRRAPRRGRRSAERVSGCSAPYGSAMRMSPDRLASACAAATRGARGHRRCRPERPGYREARARSGLRRHRLRRERRRRRAMAHPCAAQRHLARHAHQHEPGDDGLLGLPGARRPPAPPGRAAGARVPLRLRAALRRRRPDPVPDAGAAGLGRLACRRRAVRRRRRRLRSLPAPAHGGRRRRLHGRAAARLRLPRRRALPRPSDARLRERHQRPRDRSGPRHRRADRLGVPQAALRDPEGRRRRLVGLAVVHAVRCPRAAPAPA